MFMAFATEVNEYQARLSRAIKEFSLGRDIEDVADEFNVRVADIVSGFRYQI
jgi:hypothetical protein